MAQRLFGLIGYPLDHSFSKDYFQQKFLSAGLAHCSYHNFPLPEIRQLPALIATHPSLEGLNVTIPHKRSVVPLLSELDAVSAQTGSVNCIRIRNGRLHGFNTDVLGFHQSLVPLLKPWHTAALILGTGGAAHSVAYVLRQLGITYHLVSRRRKNGLLTYQDLHAELVRNTLLIVHCTPVGMYPSVDAMPPFPVQFLTPNHLVFDLIYNPATTLLMKQAMQRGATVSNGHPMLIAQAEKSWEIWNS